MLNTIYLCAYLSEFSLGSLARFNPYHLDCSRHSFISIGNKDRGMLIIYFKCYVSNDIIFLIASKIIPMKKLPIIIRVLHQYFVNLEEFFLDGVEFSCIKKTVEANTSLSL